MKCNCEIVVDRDHECYVKHCKDHEKGIEALRHWREWFEQDGDPFTWYMEMDVVCFFCDVSKAYKSETKHESDCIYVRAKKLIDGD